MYSFRWVCLWNDLSTAIASRKCPSRDNVLWRRPLPRDLFPQKLFLPFAPWSFCLALPLGHCGRDRFLSLLLLGHRGGSVRLQYFLYLCRRFVVVVLHEEGRGRSFTCMYQASVYTSRIDNTSARVPGCLLAPWYYRIFAVQLPKGGCSNQVFIHRRLS